MAKSSSLPTVLLVLLVFITFPIWVGIAGGIFGLFAGLLGALVGIFAGIFGILGAVLGAVFGAIGEVFSWIFGGFYWDYYPHIRFPKPTTLLVIILVIALIVRSRNKEVRK